MSTKDKEYIDRNLKGYEGDEYIGIELKKLVDKYNINLIVETGTFLGGTTARLAELVDQVITTEIVKENYDKSCEFIKSKGLSNKVTLVNLDSVEFLKGSQFKNDTLFFLDAHWWDACPLIDELICISNQQIRPVIVIHDWKVPGRPDLGYDSYKGQDFTFEWIRESVESIYGVDGYSYHYNDKAEGAKRGVIYIYPND